jgi:hypothetical protein
MASDLYCARADVGRRLPLGSLPSSSGLLASSVASTDVLTYDGHGLETDDQVTVRAIEGGTLSAPLVAGTVYYAIRLSNSTFRLAATAGGAAIDITSNGVWMLVTREPSYDETIEFYSRWVDGFFPAHLVPFEAPVPALVKGLVADLSAKRLLNIAGQDSAVVAAAELAAKAQLERYVANAIPLRDATATAPSNLAITSTLGSTNDSRGWCPSGSRTL